MRFNWAEVVLVLGGVFDGVARRRKVAARAFDGFAGGQGEEGGDQKNAGHGGSVDLVWVECNRVHTRGNP